MQKKEVWRTISKINNPALQRVNRFTMRSLPILRTQ